jgi:hypothetical protein
MIFGGEVDFDALLGTSEARKNQRKHCTVFYRLFRMGTRPIKCRIGGKDLDSL